MAERRKIAKRLVEKERISLHIVLKAMFLSKGSYYYQSKETDHRQKRGLDQELVRELNSLNPREFVHGYRKVTRKLKKYNHKKVYRHMKELNMLQPKKLKKGNKRRLGLYCPRGVNQRWEADLTYVWDGNKINYLFVVVDSYDKDIVGDYYGLRCRADEAIYSLEEAVKERFGSLEPVDSYRVNLRVDQGSQYISKKFKARAKELGVKIEYCGIDCPNDKAYVESFISRYKCEEVYRNEYRSFTEAMFGWLGYKRWYRTERIHQGLGWMSIPEFREQKGLHLQAQFQSKNIGA